MHYLWNFWDNYVLYSRLGCRDSGTISFWSVPQHSLASCPPPKHWMTLSTEICDSMLHRKWKNQPTHPHLETNYTGNERTHGWNIFCCPFLTKTKREWPFSGHFQSKFLLGALHFALYLFDTKIYEFWCKNRAAVWLHLYSWTWIDLTNVSGVKFW